MASESDPESVLVITEAVLFFTVLVLVSAFKVTRHSLREIIYQYRLKRIGMGYLLCFGQASLFKLRMVMLIRL